MLFMILVETKTLLEFLSTRDIKKKTPYNSTYPKMAVQWFNQA